MSDVVWKTIVVALGLVAVVQGLALVGCMRELGSLLMQVGPARPGNIGEGPDPGALLDSSVYVAARPTVLVFVSPTCSLCRPIAQALPVLTKTYVDLDVLAVVVGAGPEADHYADDLQVRTLPDPGDLYERWKIPGTPFAVGLAVGGRVVASGIVNSLPQLENLAEMIQRSPRERAAVERQSPKLLTLGGSADVPS